MQVKMQMRVQIHTCTYLRIENVYLDARLTWIFSILGSNTGCVVSALGGGWARWLKRLRGVELLDI
jgi:3-mercaptopyruvate sulfurtransferase SseA